MQTIVREVVERVSINLFESLLNLSMLLILTEACSPLKICSVTFIIIVQGRTNKFE